MEKKSPRMVSKYGKCTKCSAVSESGGCKYANAGMELPCGKENPDQEIYSKSA